MSTIRNIAAAVLVAGAAIAGLGQPAAAGDYNGDFMIRLGGSVVTFDESADVFAGGAPIVNADADISTRFIPSATLTYFFNKNLAVELFCCFAKLDVDGKGALAGFDLGDFWVFPPVVTLQYHFDSMGGFKPYLGAGVQYIHFFSEGTSPSLGGAKIDLDDAWGFALQAGVDVELGSGWYLNADVKKIWLDTEASWVGTPITADIDVDPWIISANIGYRFNLFGPRYVEPLK